jgi:hypothetical protein
MEGFRFLLLLMERLATAPFPFHKGTDTLILGVSICRCLNCTRRSLQRMDSQCFEDYKINLTKAISAETSTSSSSLRNCVQLIFRYSSKLELLATATGAVKINTFPIIQGRGILTAFSSLPMTKPRAIKTPPPTTNLRLQSTGRTCAS